MDGSVKNALIEAIEEAIQSGKLDKKAHAPVIEAALKVAAVMDEPEWPIVRGKIDNVSPSVFLKYCEALGLVLGKPAKAPKPKESEKVTSIVGKSRWQKKA